MPLVLRQLKLTSSTDETNFEAILGGGSVLSIPFFQRPYKWQTARCYQLELDILRLVEGEDDVHFVGAIIMHQLPSGPAELAVDEIIDGQQRLTTVYLYLCAAIHALALAGEAEEAAQLFRRYIVTNVPTGRRSNLRLQPSGEDQGDLNVVIRELTTMRQLEPALVGTHINLLPSDERKHGRVETNYKRAKRFYRLQSAEGGSDRIREIYTALLQQLSVVVIDVNDPTNGPKIFDSLNSRQEPMTIGDLVRNDVFLRVALEDPEQAIEIDREAWQPFYSAFKTDSKDYFDAYFFPFGLIHEPNLRKSEVYPTLKREWGRMSPVEVIDSLAVFQPDFLDLVIGGNRSEHAPSTVLRLDRLRRANLPASALPFLMQLSHAMRTGAVGVGPGDGILDVIDAFLTRRAICGFEPTGLHAVFKRLWLDCDNWYTPQRVAAEIKKHKTVSWPTDAEVSAAVLQRHLAGATIVPYLFQELDAVEGALPSPVMYVERVLPEKPDDAWTQFTDEEVANTRDLLANLVPLSESPSQRALREPYDEKRRRFAEEPAFGSTRSVAAEYARWDIEAVSSRARRLQELVLERWPDGMG
ncbi:hypothetical protein AVP42_00343 [Agromyces sp. NDB4Y10]|nr:hypothetical protein AVP42_00343 [Agromyces sp. NDB4Y10]